MKVTNNFLASVLLAATGLIGIPGLAQADGQFDRWGHDDPHAAARGPQFNQQRLVDGINDRLKNQRLRIGEGYRSGRLTRDEFARLMREHHEIRQQERRFLANGSLGPREYESLSQSLDRADKHIRIEKHDAETAYGNPGPRPYGGPDTWRH